MKKLYVILSMVLLLCFAFGCQKAEEVAEEPVVDVAVDVAAIKGLLDEFDALENADNPEKLVSIYYAEDAVRLPQDEPILEGKEAIRDRFIKAHEQSDWQVDNVAIDVYVSGDLAAAHGKSTGTVTPKVEGEPIQFYGKWVAIYKRQADGTWKCICDIYNNDYPISLPAENK